MRKRIVAGNWKMNLNLLQAKQLLEEIEKGNWGSEVEVFLFPSLFQLGHLQGTNQKITLGAQNFYPAEKGAFTGEVALDQLAVEGIQWVLIGHSERRQYFNETNAVLKTKLDYAIHQGSKVIFCCGEPLEIRENGSHFKFVKNQLEESLFHLNAAEMKQVVIAYEPIWAIGTGKTASTEQAEEMHAEIRSWLTEKYGHDTAESVSILYGGSCNDQNAQELFACPNIDGGLIGGASLKADSFLTIINA